MGSAEDVVLGQVTLLAGGGAEGLQDGIGTNALFKTPFRVRVDAKDTLLIVDHYNHAIRKITSSGYHFYFC